ncbi:MAG: PA3496 family putative envelope integrity protein [Legionellales bacterium]
MNARSFDKFESETEEFSNAEAIVPEASPSTKLERRRKIEALFEEKRLKEELAEFG